LEIPPPPSPREEGRPTSSREKYENGEEKKMENLKEKGKNEE
jgi:hypothetical protein